MGCHVLLLEFFPTQELNPGLPYCRQILYHLRYLGKTHLYNWGSENSRTGGAAINANLQPRMAAVIMIGGGDYDREQGLALLFLYILLLLYILYYI